MLELTLTPEYRAIPPRGVPTIRLLAEVSLADEGESAAPAAPLSVCFLVDASSSMRGQPFDAALWAVSEQILTLPDATRVSVVTFDADARVLVPDTLLDTSATRALVLAALADLEVGGGTNIEAALRVAGRAFVHTSDPRRRIAVLISDGYATRGSDDAQDLCALGGALDATQVALGLGPYYDPFLLDAIARSAHGVHVFAEHPGDSPPLLADTLRATLETPCWHPELELVGQTGVRVRPITDQRDAEAEWADSASTPLANLAPGEPLRALFELELVDARDSTATLDTARATLTATSADGPIEARAAVTLRRSEGGLGAPSAAVVAHASLVRCDQLRRRAQHAEEAGRPDDAIAVLRQASDALRDGIAQLAGHAGSEIERELSELRFARMRVEHELENWLRSPSRRASATQVRTASTVVFSSGGHRRRGPSGGPPMELDIDLSDGDAASFYRGRGTVTVGRGPGADVVLLNEAISRRHALIAAHGDHHRLHALPTFHGTVVDDQPLAPGMSVQLWHRSVIVVAGVATLTYRTPGLGPA